MDRVYVIALQTGFGFLLMTLVGTSLFAAIEQWAAPPDGVASCRPGDAAVYIGCYFQEAWPALRYPEAVAWLIFMANLLCVLLLTVPVSVNLHRRPVH